MNISIVIDATRLGKVRGIRFFYLEFNLKALVILLGCYSCCQYKFIFTSHKNCYKC